MVSRHCLNIQAQLTSADDFMLKTREMHALQRPVQSDYASVRNWFEEKAPLSQDEQEYILRKEDIVTLRAGRESATFDGLVERCLSVMDHYLSVWCHCKIIQRLFITEELRHKTNNPHIHYYAPHRVDMLVNLIITAVIFVLLIVPVVLMYKLSDLAQEASPFEALGILIMFTLLFGLAMSSLTTAKRQELFAASAAYCAVLVVFVSNFGVQSVQIVKA
ncbi:hypothetical protein LTR10_006838 [Elasticomyces elasticus]|nr:hypothetical protein LTR10_006838 [Elasticomyces elasticus]KAK4972759.1 hypothetical protein LTR42_006053 [Elasticomyces elasticus]